jgi:hypothetical protein
MRVTISRPRLVFIRRGPGKLHAMDTGQTPAARLTLCGRRVDAESELVLQETMESSRLCGRCLASLRAYRPPVVFIDSERPKPTLASRLF